MGEVEFRGDIGHLESMIEDMAHRVYGLAKNGKSKAASEIVASQLLVLSKAKIEKEEEPIRPKVPRREEGHNV